MAKQTLWLLIIWTILHKISSQCVYNYNSTEISLKCTCENIDSDNYLYHMERLNPQIQKDVGSATALDITIDFVNSKFSQLDKWITFPMTDQYTFWTNSKIFYNFSSCDISSITPNAFDFSTSCYLFPGLDLSYNNIPNVDFLRNTPKLERLYLKNATNSYYIFEDLFTYPCKSVLNFIDLSFTNIESINMESFSCSPELDLSFSSIKYLWLLPGFSKTLKMNLTKCENLKILESSSLGEYVSFSTLDLSNINNFNISILGVVQVSNYLNLTNTKVERLDENSYNLYDVVEKDLTIVNMSNTNLKSISKQYFSKLSFPALDLSRNELSVLEEGVFSYANIKEIDLSNSQILQVKEGCFEKLSADILLLSHNNINLLENPFQNATVTELVLSHNNISSLRNVFNKTTVTILDLSFNPIQSIDDSTFSNCLSLETLNLSNTFIPKIADRTFFPLSTLTSLEISLSGNFNPQTFESMYLKSLTISDSNILSLIDENFRGLYNLENLRFRGSVIGNISPGALKYLVNVKFMDTNVILKCLKIIPKDLFTDMLSLTYLDLSYLQFEGIEAGAFNGLINLNSLNVTGSSLEKDFIFISKFV